MATLNDLVVAQAAASAELQAFNADGDAEHLRRALRILCESLTTLDEPFWADIDAAVQAYLENPQAPNEMLTNFEDFLASERDILVEYTGGADIADRLIADVLRALPGGAAAAAADEIVTGIRAAIAGVANVVCALFAYVDEAKHEESPRRTGLIQRLPLIGRVVSIVIRIAGGLIVVGADAAAFAHGGAEPTTALASLKAGCAAVVEALQEIPGAWAEARPPQD